MSNGIVRRAQLIAPFGVGAMTVVANGTSLISAGLDHWFERDDAESDSQRVDLDEFRIEEWRLQRELSVGHLRMPPDWRTSRRYAGEVPNLKLPVPFQRFPAWNFCPRCYLLQELPLSARGKAPCAAEEHRTRGSGKAPFVAQVPFVAICEYGHLQDFPWREWVHKSTEPACRADMRLKSTGGASLSAQSVECDCGASRTLAGITEAEPGQQRTTLSSKLSDTKEYLCQGAMPWHGETGVRSCGLPIRGSLRASSNLYYALVKSSIYLPRGDAAVPEELIQALDTPPLSSLLAALRSAAPETVTPELVRGQQRELLQPYSDLQIRAALDVISGTTSAAAVEAEQDDAGGDEQPDDTEFRRPEFAVLRSEALFPYLEIREADLGRYDPRISSLLSRLTLVDKLRETRALYGFNRIFPESDHRLSDRKALLWKRPPAWRESWLPAYVVHGEGIFLEFEEHGLAAWEATPGVQARVARLASNYARARQTRRLRERDFAPRYVLLHTVAHLLMNQLTYECGYSSASLRERLYIATGERPMAGVLIYTAAGDAEGTMGGLVRMGKPGYFEPALLAALEAAEWCSADPVCMETGASGQGPDSCNMAACHSCALVPETACEAFNRFLDRALVVGSHEEPELGYLRLE